MPTVRALTDEVLLKHWSFVGRKFPPGGFVMLMQRKCDELILKYTRSVEPIIGEARQVAAVVSGTLVGVTAGGVPQYLTTSDDGWPVLLTVGGTPYFDFTAQKIATDPLGRSSANPGFPLPTDALKYITIAVHYLDGRDGPVNIVPEAQRHAGPQGRDPIAYVNGNRLVPVRAPSLSGSADEWTSVVNLRVSYIRRIVFGAMTDDARLPAVLHGALVSAVVYDLARSAKPEQVSQQEKAAFAADAAATEKALELAGDHIIGDLRNDSVIYLD